MLTRLPLIGDRRAIAELPSDPARGKHDGAGGAADIAPAAARRRVDGVSHRRILLNSAKLQAFMHARGVRRFAWVLCPEDSGRDKLPNLIAFPAPTASEAPSPPSVSHARGRGAAAPHDTSAHFTIGAAFG